MKQSCGRCARKFKRLPRPCQKWIEDLSPHYFIKISLCSSIIFNLPGGATTCMIPVPYIHTDHCTRKFPRVVLIRMVNCGKGSNNSTAAGWERHLTF
jgi:hypothetical protein